MSMPIRTKKQATRRRDPKPRHIDGSAPWTRLKNRDPDKHYVLVYAGDGAEHGVDYYHSIGYEVVEQEASGPSLTAGRTTAPGQPVSMRGHILMACTKARHDEILSYGPDGDSGQVEADDIERRIVDRESGRDLLRGLHGPRGLSAQVETQGPEELGT